MYDEAIFVLAIALPNLLRKSLYSACLMRPVLIIIVWKHCRSIAHNLQSVAAFIVAVRLQLYRIASSPNTFPGANVLRYLFSLDTSTLPSANIQETTTRSARQERKLQYPAWLA